MEKQKELDRLTKELVKQMTGNEVEDPQEGDYQIAYYYLSKAMDYTHCCKSDSEQLPDTNKHQCNCSNAKDRLDCGFECYNK